MRKVLVFSFLAAVVLSLGCAITDYPVIFDTRGADADHVMKSFYDKAYIIPSGQVATIWGDGSDELFTEVTQDWKGDQWLYTFNNFDPSGSVYFLDQTYCDPTRASDCAVAVSWNPDLPNVDDVFDYYFHPECSGARSLSVLVSYGSRYMGECGSNIMADKQAMAYEFSLLEKVTWRGGDFYRMPINADNTGLTLTSAAGATGPMPIYGQYNAYVDNRLRVAFPVTPNMKYQLRWLQNWVAENGNFIDANLVYGSLSVNYKLNATTFDGWIDRF